jgi:site-specific DNA-methyltransferase (adenine-specific)
MRRRVTHSRALAALDRITDAVLNYRPDKTAKPAKPKKAALQDSVSSFSLFKGDALDAYDQWAAPACIIADGPYGLGKYPGEPLSPDKLAEWYEPHAAAWARRAMPSTTLWFWNSEIGWANAHPALDANGWQYEETIVWDKGIAHVAGNCNSKTIRGVPVVTELAVRYTRKVTLECADGRQLPIKEWLRAEWLRSGRPMYESNKACGVVNAATRKYLTQCHMWYFPPGDAIVGMAEWCTKKGAKTDRPYFSIDGKNPPTAALWDQMRAKWTHTHGLTNVWKEPPVHNGERVRVAGSSTRYLHANQKPLALMERQIAASTSSGDVVWEPFGGLCSATVAALRLGRRAFAAEFNSEFYEAALVRIKGESSAQPRTRKAG